MSKTITVKRTSIIVEPYEIGECEEVEKMLSVWDKVYYTMKPVAFDYDVENKRLYLPRSMYLPKLKEFFGDDVIVDRSHDEISKAVFNVNTMPRDNNQKKAIAFLLSKKEFENMKGQSRLILNLDTGIGKTYTTIAAMGLSKSRTCIIVPDKTLLEQWVEKITEYTSLSTGEVYKISGSNSIKKILENDMIVKRIGIYVASISTITSYAKKYGWEAISQLFSYMGIGIKVYDEAHKMFSQIVNIDLHTNTRKTIYLTATVGRSSAQEDYIMSKNVMYGVPILSLQNDRKERDMTSVILKYNSNPSIMYLSQMKTVHGMSTMKYLQYMKDVANDWYCKCVRIILNTVLGHEGEGKIVFLLGKIDMINFTAKYIAEEYPELTKDIGVYCSEVKDKDVRKAQLEKRIILSTSKSLGTGADIAKLKYIVMIEPHSSKIISKQVTGRLRNGGYYFEIQDIGIPMVTNQFKARQNVLASRSLEIKNYNIN